MLAQAIFWIAVSIVAYVYLGYPLLLALWARVRPRPTVKSAEGAPLPGISIIVAARNEEKRLAARLDNLLAIEYPSERQIIVVSDGSTDRTPAIAARFAPAVELVECPPRGKASALNAGVARARHAILVFADARQAFASDTLLQLVRNFADESVGAVSGELVLDCEAGRGSRAASSVADGVGLYWRYEKWLRRRESAIGSTLGVTGAVYAMRRSYWRPIPVRTVLDDVLAPMRVVLAGKRVVFDGSAVAYDRAAHDASVETRRKVRTLAGNYQLAWLEPRLLLPLVNPVWLQFVSHKLGRLLVPYALLACLIASALLVGRSPLYTAAFLAQVGLMLLAAYGGVLEARARRRRPSAVPVAFAEKEPSRAKRVVNA